MPVRVGLRKGGIVFDDYDEVSEIDTDSRCVCVWEDRGNTPLELHNVTWLSDENTAKFIEAMESVLIELLEEEGKS